MPLNIIGITIHPLNTIQYNALIITMGQVNHNHGFTLMEKSKRRAPKSAGPWHMPLLPATWLIRHCQDGLHIKNTNDFIRYKGTSHDLPKSL